MKFILLSDFHGTSKNPRARKDNVLFAFRNKLEYIFKYAKKINATILQAGDLFDTPRDINALFQFISIRTKYPSINFYCIYGQHDQYYRNKNMPCNLNILQKSGLIKILDKNPIIIGPNIYGASWNEKIPKAKFKEDLNILVIHKNISPMQLWYSHKSITPDSFLNAKELLNYHLILCGDIHIKFIRKTYSKIICNTGPILRLEANKYNRKHQPMFFIYDSIEKRISKHNIPCLSYNEVIYSRYIGNKKTEKRYIFKDIVKKEYKMNIFKVIESLIDDSPKKNKIKRVLKQIQKQEIK